MDSPPCATSTCKNKRRYVGSGLCATCSYRVKRNIPLDTPTLGDLSRPVTATGAHVRVTKMWGKATRYRCVKCPKMANQWAYDGTDPSYLLGRTQNGMERHYRYSRYPEFYMPMCYSCHRSFDGANWAEELFVLREWMFRTGKTLDDLRAMA